MVPKFNKETAAGGVITISEAFNAYRSVIAFRNQSRKTEENHFVCKRSLVSFAGDIPIHELTVDDIRNWKHHLDKTKSPATVRNYIIKLRVVLGYLKLEGYECIEPSRIPVPQRADKVPSYLTKDQVSFIINSTKRVKNKAIVSLLFCSGIRISELCSLDKDSINQDGTFTVVGKGGRVRLCFVDVRTKYLLKIYLDTRIDNNHALFLTDSGIRIRPGTVQETFKTIRKQTGLECSPHTLRHSFATNLLKTNTNLFYVQQFLGHRSLQTTQQYLHVVNEDLRQIYDKHHTT